MKALVVQGGGLRGAFAVGALKSLSRHVGINYFDAIFAVSSGVFAATFYSTGQVTTMEHTWRKKVSGYQLINYRAFFKGQPILNLDYLISLFNSSSRLDLETLFKSKTRIEYVLTDFKTARPVYFDARGEGVFSLMKASAAVPLLTGPPVEINGNWYIDGALSDPLPVSRAIQLGYREIIVIMNRPFGFLSKTERFLYRIMKTKYLKYGETMSLMLFPPPSVTIHVISPKKDLFPAFSRDERRINSAIDYGEDITDKQAPKLFQDGIYAPNISDSIAASQNWQRALL